MAEGIEAVTARLCMRQWRDEDAEPFAQLNSDQRVMEFFPAVLDRSGSDGLLHRLRAGIEERGWGLWAVETRSDRRFVGFVGLQPVPANLPFSPAVEVGWRLAFDYWGRGYATEGASWAVGFGFQTIDLKEIVSFTVVHHKRSRAVMERLRMRVMSQTFEHPNIPVGSPLREHCLYRLSREEWIRDAGLPTLAPDDGTRLSV